MRFDRIVVGEVRGVEAPRRTGNRPPVCVRTGRRVRGLFVISFAAGAYSRF
jgi:hypothetical protein